VKEETKEKTRRKRERNILIEWAAREEQKRFRFFYTYSLKFAKRRTKET
jgi:hypothetical protein